MRKLLAKKIIKQILPFNYFLGVFLMTIFTNPISAHAKNTPWVVTYSNTNPIADFSPYKVIVLDNTNHPSLSALQTNEKIILGYLSVGEVNQNRDYFKEVKNQNLLMHENPNWSGSFTVNIDDVRWVSRITKQLIPSIINQGFHGIFVDTLDIPIHLAATQPSKFGNMRFAIINLIRDIRTKFPNIKIMINRAYSILPEIASDIDMVLGESVYSTYNFTSKKYELVSNQDYQIQISQLKSLKKQFPKIEIMTLDYWYPEDQKGIKLIYDTQRANGFSPYVATIELNQIVPGP